MPKIEMKKNLGDLFKAHRTSNREQVLYVGNDFPPVEEEYRWIFSEEVLTNASLSVAYFQSCNFVNCIFEECQVLDTKFVDCEFSGCLFRQCGFSSVQSIRTRFENTRFEGGSLTEGLFSDVFFDKVVFVEIRHCIDLRFSGCWYKKVESIQCMLAHLHFETPLEQNEEMIRFSSCGVFFSHFRWFDLRDTVFEHSNVQLCSFTNSQISASTFMPGNTTLRDQYNSIDFQTVLDSEIPSSVLVGQFGIHQRDLKSYIKEMVHKVELHTVFIPYCFADKVFAYRINEALKARGAFTFLWEKDVPAGQRLNKIMADNVQKFDKVLFIASKHSLKSEACHFELSNGRKKQDKNWELVLFPIHIDPFLFTVTEEDIPRKYRAEFWMNIQELREINSTDFSAIAGETIDPARFDQQVDKLIWGLRKKPN